MQSVTKRLVSISLVDSPDQRSTLIQVYHWSHSRQLYLVLSACLGIGRCVQAAEFLYRLTIGSVSAVLGASSVYPLDLLKTRMMNQRSRAGPETMKTSYNDTLDCLRKVVRYEGITGLYRGRSLVGWLC